MDSERAIQNVCRPLVLGCSIGHERSSSVISTLTLQINIFVFVFFFDLTADTQNISIKLHIPFRHLFSAVATTEEEQQQPPDQQAVLKRHAQ